MKLFFSATIDGRNLIFDHQLHIGTPYRGKCFWTHQIPTSCLPILLIFKHIEHTFVYEYQIPVINSCLEKCDEKCAYTNVCSMCLKINKIGKQEVGIWWVQKHFPRYGVPQASYMYTILWVAFLDPSDSYFLFANLVGFYTHYIYAHFSSHFKNIITMQTIDKRAVTKQCRRKITGQWAVLNFV
jgi:hypothetical protein